jgi:hypothetical protein
MKPVASTLTAVLGAVLFAAPPALADEGMWTFDQLPLQRLATDHRFTPPAGWADHLRLSSVRLAQGCSGSFISAKGLVLSNHHCARACAQGLSTPTHSLMAFGFLAATLADERKCPDLEVNQLIEITHVTDQIKAATAGRSGPAFRDAERAAIAAAERGCNTGEDVRCDVVTLFHGGVYDLYKYRRYQDVRLVFLPEEAAATFGDATVSDWPLHALDMSLVRVYAHGAPLDTSANHFTFATAAAKPGDLVFVVGNPAQTDRLSTVAELEEERDVLLPIHMADDSELHGLISETARESPEFAGEVSTLVFGSQLEASRYTLEHRALSNTGLLAARARQESDLRARIAADPVLAARYGGAWDAIAAAVSHLRAIDERLMVLEVEPQEAGLIETAVVLVRNAAEAAKPDAERLSFYRDSSRPALRSFVLSAAPVYPEVETRKLTWLFSRLQPHLGSADPAVVTLLGDESPHDLAARLMAGTRLGDVAQRQALLDGGAAAIAASTDPLIVYVRDRWNRLSRPLREDYEANVVAVLTANSALIDQARLAVLGAGADPDATFTPRVAYGVVRGYAHGGAAMPAQTTIGEAFALDTGHDPYRLPRSWLDAKAALDPATPLDVAATADIVGGNSGSPLLNRDGQLVGLIFAGNDAAEGGTFGYDDIEMRAIAVTKSAIREALEHIYHADRIVREIDEK